MAGSEQDPQREGVRQGDGDSTESGVRGRGVGEEFVPGLRADGQARSDERREIKKITKSKPTEHDLPFSTWSLTKLADFLVAEGVVDDISHEGLRILLREEGVTFQRGLNRLLDRTGASCRDCSWWFSPTRPPNPRGPRGLI
jgi:hypothetical protein